MGAPGWPRVDDSYPQLPRLVVDAARVAERGMSRRNVKKPTERTQTYWSCNVGDYGVVVHASERPDRSHAIVFRWSDPSRSGTDKRV